MSRKLSLLMANLAGILILAANVGGETAAPDNPKTEDADKPVRVSLDEAERLVEAKIRVDDADMSPMAKFPLEELTTDEIWNKLHIQVFKITDGVRARDTFVIYKNKAIQIGQGFGGNGVETMCLADLNNDGKPELVYIFSWGSGIHRSQVGVMTFDKTALKNYVASFSYKHPGGKGKLSIKPEVNELKIYDGKQRIGKVAFEKNSNEWNASVKLDPDLPDEFKKRVW